jgi:hypothetical protein
MKDHRKTLALTWKINIELDVTDEKILELEDYDPIEIYDPNNPNMTIELVDSEVITRYNRWSIYYNDGTISIIKAKSRWEINKKWRKFKTKKVIMKLHGGTKPQYFWDNEFRRWLKI